MILNIKERMEKMGITRYELAKRTGLSYPTVMKMYNGSSTAIKFENLESICKILNCSPNDILIFEKDSPETLYNNVNETELTKK